MCGKLPPKLWSPGETRRAGKVLLWVGRGVVGKEGWPLPCLGGGAQQHQGAAFPPTEGGL